ncbi:Na+/H+-dicarboxylate symporter [Bacilli bacterium PM5-3]|nr:Na+/H+-dicarboxylate symporter [Bacilli bacterium PM5-3]
MKSILKNYGTSILLLTGVVIGGICGIIFKEQTEVVKPIGDLFLNMMFCTIVPLIFFSISAAVAKTSEMSRLGKILKNSVVVFFATGTVAALIAYFCCLIFNPMSGTSPDAFSSFITTDGNSEEALTVGEMIVNLFTVSDFKLLFNKGTLLPLIIFTLAFGIATASLKEKAKAMADFLTAGSEVILKIVGYVMKLAPIGLGCYFAYTVGQLGPQLLTGFLNSFLLYMLMTVVYFFGFFTLFAFISGGSKGVKVFWKNAIDPSLSAIATSSSAACIPINIISTKKWVYQKMLLKQLSHLVLIFIKMVL